MRFILIVSLNLNDEACYQYISNSRMEAVARTLEPDIPYPWNFDGCGRWLCLIWSTTQPLVLQGIGPS